MMRRARTGAVVFLTILAACGKGEAPALEELDRAATTFARDFDRDVDHPRLVMLLSPTTGSCRAGLATVRRHLLVAELADIRLYVIWLPVRPDDDQAAARRAAGRLRDPRVAHYWQADGSLGGLLGRALPIPSPHARGPHGFAWDVYLLYPRGVTWADRAIPLPKYWMHQLDHIADARLPRLDGALLRQRVEALR